MISSEYLYDGLDKETAELQLALFLKKEQKARDLIVKLKPDFDVKSFTEKQRQLETRIVKIKKAIEFSQNQCAEAREVLN